RGLLQVHAELVRNDVRERRLAETGRSEEERVIERFAALTRGRDEDRHLLLDARLADVVREAARTHGAVERLVLVRRGRRHYSRPFAHARPPRACTRFSASRISSSVARRLASSPFSMRSASAGL